MKRLITWTLTASLCIGISAASATSVLSQGGGGTVPTEASDVYGAWDQILVGGILPVAAIAVGLIVVLGSIQRGSSTGIVGGVVTAILGTIGTMALPGIITGTGGASPLFGLTQAGSSVDPTLFVVWGAVNFWKFVYRER